MQSMVSILTLNMRPKMLGYTTFNRFFVFITFKELIKAEVLDEHTKTILAALDLYFLDESGERFKVDLIEIKILNKFRFPIYSGLIYSWRHPSEVNLQSLHIFPVNIITQSLNMLRRKIWIWYWQRS